MKPKRIFALLLAVSLLVSCLIFSTYATDLEFSVVGASMRITGTQGLRFIGKIANNGAVTLTTGENANFGIILIPKSMLESEATAITKDTPNAKIVPAQNLLIESTVTAAGLIYTPGSYYFSAVLTGIPEEFYGAEIVARAYVKNGNTYTYSAQTTRSVASVAQGIAANANAPAAQKTYANSVLAIYQDRGIDLLLKFPSNWNS